LGPKFSKKCICISRNEFDKYKEQIFDHLSIFETFTIGFSYESEAPELGILTSMNMLTILGKKRLKKI
jgi:hypothetical protein